jgi:hypothetical protein
VPVQLDGQPKLIARDLVDPAVVALEPGLDLSLSENEGEFDLAVEARCH